ncbi:sarcosine oxidase subunit gamma [Rhodobacteraceae bacterium]|nr:sarcosine oxidase subunit gamma [Paracoccaceae bacterium]
MSNSISQANRPFDGYVTVSEDAPMGMLMLRGDLSSKPFITVLKKSVSTDLPSACHITHDEQMSVGWMSPDELLILTPYDQVAVLQAGLQKALGKKHFLLADVSDARVSFTLSGDKVREVIAKLAPVDLAPSHFAPGMFRRTRFGQISAALWLLSETEARVICFRSVAEFMFNQLSAAARPGSEVDLWN